MLSYEVRNSMIKYALLLLSMTLAITGQFFFKSGLSESSLTPQFQSIVRTVFTPKVFMGFALYGISSIVWLFVLQKLPLSVAYPALALTYVIVVFASVLILHEPLTVNKVVGSFIIVMGVILMFR
jgi:drug/metabolite transporter (DMT)-like permease